ncbi:MAG: hypothetical protein WDN24_01735 [Sphingomonas sp.]
MAASLLALSMVCTAVGVAVAGSFQVNPVQLVLQPNKTMSSLTIRNVEQQPVSVRVLTYRWTQVSGDDVYTPTDDLIASRRSSRFRRTESSSCGSGCGGARRARPIG